MDDKNERKTLSEILEQLNNLTKSQQEMTLWNDVLDQLKSKLSAPSFNTWLSQTVLRPFNPEDDKLNIEVQSEFNGDWIKGRYEQLISEIIFKTTGKDYKLNFIVNPKLETTNEAPTTIYSENHQVNSCWIPQCMLPSTILW